VSCQEVEVSDGVKNRQPLLEDESFSGESDLHLTNIDFTDDGRYVCQLSNELGSFQQPIDLHVLGTNHLTLHVCQKRGRGVYRGRDKDERSLTCA